MSKGYDGPTEFGSDGKLYPKGEAPHSNFYHEQQSRNTPNDNDNPDFDHRTIGGKGVFGSILDGLFNSHSRGSTGQKVNGLSPEARRFFREHGGLQDELDLNDPPGYDREWAQKAGFTDWDSYWAKIENERVVHQEESDGFEYMAQAFVDSRSDMRSRDIIVEAHKRFKSDHMKGEARRQYGEQGDKLIALIQEKAKKRGY